MSSTALMSFSMSFFASASMSSQEYSAMFLAAANIFSKTCLSNSLLSMRLPLLNCNPRHFFPHEIQRLFWKERLYCFVPLLALRGRAAIHRRADSLFLRCVLAACANETLLAG